jgi:hypothetical protein
MSEEGRHIRRFVSERCNGNFGADRQGQVLSKPKIQNILGLLRPGIVDGNGPSFSDGGMGSAIP